LLWNLYNSDGDQAGSYFGTQEANRPLHALYALDNGTVTLDNLGGHSQSGLSVEAKVYSLAGAVLDDQSASNITLASQQVLNRVLTPKVPAGSPVQVFFVELQLRQNGTLLDRNVYWLSHPARRGQLETRAGPAAGRDLYLCEPDVAADAAAGVRHRHRHHGQPARAGRRGPRHHRHDHQHLRVGRRLPAPGRRAAGHASGQELAGDNELQSSVWQKQRRHAVPGESQKLTVTWNSADSRGPRQWSACLDGTFQVDIPAP